MSKCIVHIGMHKTGSTSIQRSLYAHLPDQRFRYISIKGSNQSMPLMALFGRSSESSRGPGGRLLAAYSRNFELALRNCKNRIGIISGEAISTLPASGLRQMHEQLSRHFRTIEAVAYIRSPKAYLESAFQQRVKAGFKHFKLDVVWPRYRHRFEKFDTLFQRDHVSLWKFDPPSFVGRDVVLDYCHRLGIDFPPDGSIRVNESLSSSAVKLLHTYFKYRSEPDSASAPAGADAALTRKLMTLPGPKFHLSSELIAPLMQRHESDIRWMEERLGATLDEGKCSINRILVEMQPISEA